MHRPGQITALVSASTSHRRPWPSSPIAIDTCLSAHHKYKHKLNTWPPCEAVQPRITRINQARPTLYLPIPPNHLLHQDMMPRGRMSRRGKRPPAACHRPAGLGRRRSVAAPNLARRLGAGVLCLRNGGDGPAPSQRRQMRCRRARGPTARRQ